MTTQKQVDWGVVIAQTNETLKGIERHLKALVNLKILEQTFQTGGEANLQDPAEFDKLAKDYFAKAYKDDK